MGGDAFAVSQVGAGSTFSVRLPLRLPPESTKAAPPLPAVPSLELKGESASTRVSEEQKPQALAADETLAAPPLLPSSPQSLRVLLADDVETNRKLSTRILSKAGHEVTTACDGLEALKQAIARLGTDKECVCGFQR